MNFAIIPFEDPSPDFINTIMNIDSGAYIQYAPKIYFVNFSGTADSLATRVGFSKSATVGILGNAVPKPGIVLRISDYFGYGNASMWDWLKK